MARVLVTGGAGFIGSALARRLLAEGAEAVVVDDLSTGRRGNVPAEATFVECDLADEAAYARLPPVETVFHLAAQSSGEISHEDPADDLRRNALASLRLALWCRRMGARRLLLASSMGVYGDARGAVAEDAPLRPRSFYGVSKAATEGYARAAEAEGGAPATVLRLFNVYGPGQDLSNMKQGMLSIYLAHLLAGGPVVVRGSLDRYRDFVHVDDVVEAFLACARTSATAGRTYNVGSGVRTTVRELVDALRTAAGRPDAEVRREAGTPGDIEGTWARIESIRRDAGWAPRVPLAEGIRATVAWARQKGA